MVNPLLEYANASIAFTVPSPGIYLDALGNVCPNYSIVDIQCFLKVRSGKTAVSTEMYPGIDLNARDLHGYTCSQKLPIEVPRMNWYKGKFGTDWGWFFLRPASRFGGTGIDLLIEQEIDTHIEGFFQLKRTT